MTLEEIIIKAIPLESCPQKTAHAIYRRAQLQKRIEAYIAENYEPIKYKSGNGNNEHIREVLPMSN